MKRLPLLPLAAIVLFACQEATQPLATRNPNEVAPRLSGTVEPPEGLVSWWPGDGHANDIVGGNHGTLQNGATFAPGMAGQAFSFSGVDDFVEIADSPDLTPSNAFTVDGWFFIDPIAPGNDGDASTLASKSDGSSSGGGWHLDFDDRGYNDLSNTVRLEVFQAAGVTAVARADNIITTSGWYHIAAVFDLEGTPQGRIYLNADLVGTSNITLSSILPNTLSMRIGAMHHNECCGGNINDRLNGLADEVEYFNVALTQAEIQAIYEAGKAGKRKPPVCVLHNGHTIRIAAAALQAHLAHGDEQVACPS